LVAETAGDATDALAAGPILWTALPVMIDMNLAGLEWLFAQVAAFTLTRAHLRELFRCEPELPLEVVLPPGALVLFATLPPNTLGVGQAQIPHIFTAGRAFTFENL
jgi:hypothetical protein